MSLSAQIQLQNAMINVKKGRKPDYPNSEPNYETRIRQETYTKIKEDGTTVIRTKCTDIIKKSSKISKQLNKKRPNKSAKSKVRTLSNCSPIVTRTNGSGNRVTKQVRTRYLKKLFNKEAVSLIKEGRQKELQVNGRINPKYINKIYQTPLG